MNVGTDLPAHRNTSPLYVCKIHLYRPGLPSSMDVEDDFGGYIRQAIIGDDAIQMVVPLAAAGDDLERSELVVCSHYDDGGWP